MKKELFVCFLSLSAGFCQLIMTAGHPDAVYIHFEKAGKKFVSTKDGIGRPYMQMKDSSPGMQIDLPETWKGDFTISAWIRIDSHPDNGKVVFDRTSPAVIAHLKGASDVIFRVSGGKLELALAKGNLWKVATGKDELPLRKWMFVAATYKGGSAALYRDGMMIAKKTLPGIIPEYSRLIIGRSGARRLHGGIDEFRLYKGDPGTDVLQSLFSARGGAFNQIMTEEFSKTVLRGGELKAQLPIYPQLMVGKDVLHPIAAGASSRVECVKWNASNSYSLLIDGIPHFFGSSVSIYKQVDKDERGLPVYSQGAPLALQGRNFKVLRREDGLFDLLALGEGTPFANSQLIHYRNTGNPGAPNFGTPVAVPVGWKDIASALNMPVGGITLHDFDGDGIVDLLIGAGSGFGPNNAYWPDHSNIHNRKPNVNSGPGRGYDISGRWLGEEGRTKLFWSKGGRDAKGNYYYCQPRPVYLGDEDYQVQWRYYGPNLVPGVIVIGGSMHILLAGEVDSILALPCKYVNGELRCDKATPLLAEGKPLEEMYWTDSISVADLDGDGKEEIVLSGNPGRVVVLKGESVGKFYEAGSLLMKGGQIQTDTLATPARGDWDGDSHMDLICGDASGWLTYWPGTENPIVYKAPVFLQTPDGKRVHHQAGPSGSIQGPNERRWGYMQPTLGDWDGDGDNEIITSDITGTLSLYGRINSSTVDFPRVFTMGGKLLPAAWRVRPAILSAVHGYAGGKRPALLYLDWDGDASLAIPSETGGVEIEKSDKLYYTDGEAVRLSGIRGHWGRAKLAVTDWDGDGNWDIVWGTNSGVHPFIWKENPPKGGTPCWLRNAGTNEKPVFERLRIIHLADGSRMDFRTHNTSVWPTDLDGDGSRDLIIGAEDGKIYYFYSKDLEASGQTGTARAHSGRK